MKYKAANHQHQGRPFILSAALAFLISLSNALAQNTGVTGQVLDNEGLPIPGVTILEKGTSNGTITDFDGRYSINVPSNAILSFSFVGFRTQEVEVSGRTDISLELELDIASLDEVVVIGYGTTEKSDLTGSIASVDVDQLQKFSSIDVRQNLQGAIAGVQVTSTGGAPGAGGNTIRIRGVGSFSNADPLFVVDGFITNDLSNIAPSDIQSMEVLKDASATAIYGSRGANGVIIVTTKQARSGKLKLDVNSYYGVQSVWNTYDVLDANQYAQAYLISRFGEAGTVDDLAEGPTKNWIQGALDGSIAGTDWQEEVTQTAPIFNTEIALSGGNEVVKYKFGGVIFSQDGTIIETYSDRIQLHAGLSVKPVEWVQLDANIRYSKNEYLSFNQGTYSSILATAVRKDPLTNVFAPGTDFYDRSGLVDVGNPVRNAFDQKKDIATEDRTLLNFKATFDLLPGLKFNSVLAVDNKDIDRFYDFPEMTTINSQDESANNIATNESRDSAYHYTDKVKVDVIQSSNYFNYSKKLGLHSFGADVGMEYYRNEYNADFPFTGAIDESNFTLLSYFGRANYSYDGKYLITATIRRDGSSKFAEGNKWGSFPSLALAWNVDQESFFNTGLFSGLKLRAGWGRIGNQDAIQPYGYLAILQPNYNYSFDNASESEGYAALELPAETLTWETSEMLNVGVDMLMLDDRISLTVDYFDKDTKDLLVQALPAPNFAGAIGPSSNAASMNNEGFEFTLSYQQFLGDFRFKVGGNIAFITNKVTDLGAQDLIFGGNEESKIGMPATRTLVGQEFATFYGLRTLGIFQSDEEADNHRAVNEQGLPIDRQGFVLTNVDPDTHLGTREDGTESEQALIQRNAVAGDVIYADTNFDGNIDEDDAVPLGSAIPDFTYGIFLNADYKQFDLNVTISGTHGNEAANIFTYYSQGSSATLNNLSVDRFENRWTEAGSSNTVPRLSASGAQNDLFSDRYVEDASFLRVRNVQIGYTFAKTTIQKLKMSKLRLYLSADNLLTLTNYSGLDPEIGGRSYDSFSPGVDYFNYPLARTFFFGANLTF